MSFEFLAEQQLALATEMALFAQLGVVGRHFVADVEALHCAADLDDDAGRLVARDHGHVGQEVAISNRQILLSTCWCSGASRASRTYRGCADRSRICHTIVLIVRRST